MKSDHRHGQARRRGTARRRIAGGRGAACAALLLAFAACRHETPPAAAGATETKAPQVVALDPPQGARDVDPARAVLSVTFDRDMDPEGWSWVIETPETAPELGDARFDAAARTNTVAVRLEPGRTYVVWVNSPQYAYFRDRAGISAEPLRWSFTTRGASTPAAAPAPVPAASPARVPLLPAHRSAPSDRAPQGAAPQVVTLSPPNGAAGVDPALQVLRARFDRPMEASWSWVSEGASFPQTTGQAYFESDGLTAALPVKLEPGREYVVWLNSSEYRLFRDRAGNPAPPLRWTFSTRPAAAAGR